LEYTVIGDTVNVASRMGGLGEGGEVVLPRATYNQVCDGFVFDSMGGKSVKGVKDTIECGRIHAESDDVVRKVSHAIALAFDLTLPSDVRTMVGDMNT
jgi:class 3 adenylate cyclase